MRDRNYLQKCKKSIIIRDFWKQRVSKIQSVLQTRQKNLNIYAKRWLNNLLYYMFKTWKNRVTEKKMQVQKVNNIIKKFKVYITLFSVENIWKCI